MDSFWRFRVSSCPFQSRTAVAENASSFDVLPRVVKFEIRKRRTGLKTCMLVRTTRSSYSEATNHEWESETDHCISMSPSFSQWKQKQSTALGPRDGEDAGNVKHVAWTTVQYNARWHARWNFRAGRSRGEGTKESWGKGKGHGCYCCTSTTDDRGSLRRRRLEIIATAGAPN
jgi:hypothetical protein